MQKTKLKGANFWPLLSYIGLGLGALIPRILDLGRFATHDEVEFWLPRSESFLNAILSGRFAATALSDHPGVTTMWLGSAGIILRRLVHEWGGVEITFPLLLALMRLPAALTHTLGILGSYWLLRKLFPASLVAFLAAWFWATDPFLIGYSRLLHVDALTATFLTLSLLALCHYWYHTPHLSSLILAGGCAGLAMLSKSPALAIVPIATFGAFLSTFASEDRKKSRLSSLFALLLWGLVCTLTVLIVWPAVWAAGPLEVYQQLRVGVVVEGAKPHMLGNFFLGREDPAPGFLFYPVALALRNTPWSLVGLLLLPWAWQAQKVAFPSKKAYFHDLATLASFIIFFLVAMSFFPKKFNRYILPIFPSLDILAAVGIAWGIEQVTKLAQRSSLPQQQAKKVLSTLIACIAALNVAWYHPYSITYFNQLLGGSRAGAANFAVGWGEGLDQVAAWLNQQPDITGVKVAAEMVKSLQPYLRPGAQAFTPRPSLPLAKVGYVVVYLAQAQGTLFAPFNEFYRQTEPLHVVKIHGVDYAWIYQFPPPVANPFVADFGKSIHLRGFEAQGESKPGQNLNFKLFWQAKEKIALNYWLFVHLIDAKGKVHSQLDLPLLTRDWEKWRYLTTEFTLALPKDAPPGEYQVGIGWYDEANGQRLPFTLPSHPPSAPLSESANMLLLTQIVLEDHLAP